jgi:hypothetical protein
MHDVIIASSAFVLICSVIYKMKMRKICQCWEVKLGTPGCEGCSAVGNTETDGEIWLLNDPHKVGSVSRKKMKTGNTEGEE